MNELSTALTGILATFAGIITVVLGVFALHAPKLAKIVVELALERLDAMRTRRVSNAAETAVAATEEAMRGAPGVDKLGHALIVARTLAPKASDAQLTEVVQAAVGRMRASLPNPSMMPPASSGTSERVVLDHLPGPDLLRGDRPLPPPGGTPSEMAKTPYPPVRKQVKP